MSVFPSPDQRAAIFVALRKLNPEIPFEVEDYLENMELAEEAVVWASQRLPLLVNEVGTSRMLARLVDEARALTNAPSIWAVRFSGDLESKRASFRALAGYGTETIPAPTDVSWTVIAQAVSKGRAVWSDDASGDEQFNHSASLLPLRSIGCIPLGPNGVLYLSDPDVPALFVPVFRTRLAALCALLTPFLTDRDGAGTNVEPFEPIDGIIGRSRGMAEMSNAIRAFAPMPWSVLVLGETGTGKELVARALHDLSPRASEPFVVVNCGTIPEDLAESTLFGHERGAFTGADRKKRGLVEEVGNGTLFLDEIGELSLRLQVKLLRLLEAGTFRRVGGEHERRFEGRVVAATWRVLEDPQERGPFREDLYYRLAACVIRVPPLRERQEDIPDLAAHLLEASLSRLSGDREIHLARDSLNLLLSQHWPGNVRELENAIRGAIARSIIQGASTLEPEHFQPNSKSSGHSMTSDHHTDLQTATTRFQQQLVSSVLEACQGNRTKAAQTLGVSRQWLHNLISRWGMAEPNNR